MTQFSGVQVPYVSEKPAASIVTVDMGFRPTRRCIYSKLHGVTSQKTPVIYVYHGAYYQTCAVWTLISGLDFVQSDNKTPKCGTNARSLSVAFVHVTPHKMRTAPISFVISGRPSVSTCNRRPRWTDLRESWYWRLLLKSVEKQLIWLKSDHNIGHFTWRPKCILR